MGVKISQLPAIVSPAMSDVFPVSSGGVTYKETVTQLASLLTASGGLSSFTSPSIANHIAVFTNTAGNISQDVTTAINGGNIQAGLSGTAGYLSTFPGTASTGSLRFVAAANAGDTVTEVTNASFGQATVLTIPDPASSTASFILSKSATTQTASLTSSSATPNFNSFVGAITLTNSVVTSGQAAGLAGTIDMVGASGGDIFGTLGQVVPTGTLSGTVNCTALYGVINTAAATINGGGLISAIRGHWNNTTGTPTSLASCYGIAFTNGGADVLNAQMLLTGDATNLFLMTGASTYFLNAGAGANSAGAAAYAPGTKVLQISINGTPYYIKCYTSNA